MYGSMELDATRPLLSGKDLRHRRESSKVSSPNAERRSTGPAQSPVRRGLVPFASNRAVLTEILKPRRREDANNATEGGPTTTINTNRDMETGGSNNGNQPLRLQKSFVYTMLNPRSEAWQAVTFKWFISLVILADLVSFVISTEPDLTPEQNKRFHTWEGVTSTIFLVEYMTRMFVVTEAKKYREKGPVMGRLKYASTFPALIDFFATFPFFLEAATGWNLPTLTYLRSFRLLRILKTSGFAEATNAVYRVIFYNRQILYVAMLVCVALVLFTSVLMYYLRPKEKHYSQEFTSLGSTMYLSTLMLTGQGGPDGDLPWYTKGVVLLTGVFSIGMFAIPASMLTWGFEAEAERCARLAYARSRKPTQAAVDNDTWSYSSEDYSTDEEYRRIIAGGDESDEDEEEIARQAFVTADVDGSGNISLSEFLALSKEKAEKDAKLAHTSTEKFASRLETLETLVEQNNKKLDEVCTLLLELKAKQT